jgi:hypothetical protein
MRFDEVRSYCFLFKDFVERGNLDCQKIEVSVKPWFIVTSKLFNSLAKGRLRLFR